jgi:hypothetical protein
MDPKREHDSGTDVPSELTEKIGGGLEDQSAPPQPTDWWRTLEDWLFG